VCAPGATTVAMAAAPSRCRCRYDSTPSSTVPACTQACTASEDSCRRRDCSLVDSLPPATQADTLLELPVRRCNTDALVAHRVCPTTSCSDSCAVCMAPSVRATQGSRAGSSPHRGTSCCVLVSTACCWNAGGTRHRCHDRATSVAGSRRALTSACSACTASPTRARPRHPGGVAQCARGASASGRGDAAAGCLSPKGASSTRRPGARRVEAAASMGTSVCDAFACVVSSTGGCGVAERVGAAVYGEALVGASRDGQNLGLDVPQSHQTAAAQLASPDGESRASLCCRRASMCSACSSQSDTEALEAVAVSRRRRFCCCCCCCCCHDSLSVASSWSHSRRGDCLTYCQSSAA
jgi:hypothetical protein